METESKKIKIGWFTFSCCEDSTIVMTELMNEHWQEWKKIVAIGACACIGMPSAQRNYFNKEQKQEIETLIARFSALPEVLKVSDVVKIDAEVPGCPMDPDKFLNVVSNLVKEFNQ